MGCDALPGNAAHALAGEYAAPLIAGGMTPGVDQAQLAGASLRAGLMAGAVGEGRGPGAHDDVPSPQPIHDRPSLAVALASTAVGDDTAAESLPGRLYPLFSDGEATWHNGAGEYAR